MRSSQNAISVRKLREKRISGINFQINGKFALGFAAVHQKVQAGGCFETHELKEAAGASTSRLETMRTQTTATVEPGSQ
jgi:hypothetical protein